jgi:DNA modification methylase
MAQAAHESSLAQSAPSLRPLTVRRVKLSDLHADPANARRHDERNLAAIADSLKTFGQVEPLVVQRSTGKVIGGNGRLEVLRKQGATECDIVEVDVNDTQAAALGIALNRTAEMASWDDESLAAILKSLPDDALAATGFTDDDLNALLEELNPPTVVEDEVPEPLPTPVSLRGDLWLLGGHRLLCGDSTDLNDVLRLMDGQKAALCATDPPYLVDYTGERVGDSGKDWSATYHEIDIPDADKFFRALFTNVLKVIAGHAAIYCWHAHKRQHEIALIWRDLGILDHQQVIWVKPSSVFGSVFYHFRHEPCMMGWVKGSKPAHDGKHEFDSVWEVDWEGKARFTGDHPTTKPLELFARPMRKHTKVNDICFEPFSGSGSQIIAAEQMKRRCYAIELEPVFVDVAVRRWQGLTGLDATLDGEGRTWEQVKAERLPTEKTPEPSGVGEGV